MRKPWLPSLARMHELVQRVEASGLPVDVAIEGAAAELPPGVDVSAYRIVQEGLTNVLKHSDATRAQVLVRYGTESIEIKVANDGVARQLADRGGRGLAGIGQRVSLHAGTMHAGPTPGGGFSLRAILMLAPLSEQSDGQRRDRRRP